MDIQERQTVGKALVGLVSSGTSVVASYARHIAIWLRIGGLLAGLTVSVLAAVSIICGRRKAKLDEQMSAIEEQRSAAKLCEWCRKGQPPPHCPIPESERPENCPLSLKKRKTDGGLTALLLCVLFLAGCSGPRALKGGKATTVSRPAQFIEQTVTQSENPAQVSLQNQETVKIRTYTVPAGSRLEETKVVAAEAGPPVTNVQAVVVSAPMPVIEREETRAKTELGAAQKDTAREIGAKLSSLKSIVWVGVVLFLFGLASLFYPPLRAIIGSVTTSAAILAGGWALMVLPRLIVGNELLIWGGVGVAVGGWFFAHRHGQLKGIVDANNSEKGGEA